jgi:flagellar biosynthesis protein FlhF
MQVKKFEARNMKEALELVKNALGPDAIIVAAKENNKGYGLMAEGSVEVTAAVSEYALKKKQLAESRLTERDRQKLQKIPARVQKDFINSVVEKKLTAKPQEQPATQQVRPRGMTRTPYVDIQDEDRESFHAPAARGRSVQDWLDDIDDQKTQAAARRQQDRWAAGNSMTRLEEAFAAREREMGAEEARTLQAVSGTAQQAQYVAGSNAQELVAARQEAQFLRNEVAALKKIIEDFQKVPQKFLSVHPGADHGLPYEVSHMFEKMQSMGLNLEFVVELLNEAQKQMPLQQIKKKPMLEGWVAKQILSQTDVSDDPFAGTCHVFFGPNGQGKTSSIVKMASHLIVEKRRRVAIVTTDTFKIGAADQMKIFAQILNVPFAVVRHQADWNTVLSRLGQVDHILVDMPGVQLRHAAEIELMKQLLPPPSLSARKHLVISANTKDADGREVLGRYNILQPQDLLFSCVDEVVQYGVIFNLHKYGKLPLHSFGIGPKVPEDWEVATRERLVDLLFKLTKTK